jgi:hypothetical protein
LVGNTPELDNPEAMILNCYRLADRYKQNPMVFLNTPISEVNWHVHYTILLSELQQLARERERDKDDD